MLQKTHADLTDALQAIVEHSEHVAIAWDRIPALAEHLKLVLQDAAIVVPPWADPTLHTDEFPLTNDEQTIQYFFVMVPQGFEHHLLDPDGNATIWEMEVAGQRRIGVHAQYACAMRALRQGQKILDPDYLSRMTAGDVADFYRNEATGVPNLSDLPGRLDRFHEIGRVLLERYQGQYANLLQATGGHLFRVDGNGIVQRLIEEFPLSYGDWPFCKLSVTPARMLYDRRRPDIATSDAYLRLTTIHDLDHFEAGADVARPFVLIRLGILQVSPYLGQILRDCQAVGPQAQVYNEARAAAMLVCRELVRLSGLSSPEIGGDLWATGFYRCPRCRPYVTAAELPCTHRSICHAYNQAHELFALAPMVGTGD